MNWNQPSCDVCWEDREGRRTPVRKKDRERETCAWCGSVTYSGIYVRVDPRTVKYPKEAENG